MADVTIEVKADATQAAGELKKVSGDLKKSSADPNAAIPNKQSAPAVGKAIGSAVVGYIANQGLDTLATVVGNAQGGQRTGRRIAAIGGSAVAGTTLGAMAEEKQSNFTKAIDKASLVIYQWAKNLDRSSESLHQIMMGLERAHIASIATTTFGQQDRAFGRVISTKQRAEQVKAVEDRLTKIRFGEGENSIRNLQKRILKAAESGETDNIDYMRDRDLFTRQKAREATLERQLEDLRVPVAAPMMRATEVGDALSAMGGSVGVSVNVADINQRQLTTLERIYEVLARRAGDDPTASIAWKDHTYYQ